MLKKILSFTACFFLLFANNVFSSDCIKVKGKINTNTLDLKDKSLPTLGTLSFRANKEKNHCSIQGQTIGVNELGLPELAHHVVCKDHSTFNTKDSVIEFTPNNECEIYIHEETVLIPTSEKYKGYIGKTKTKGTINLCSGENDFKFKGQLCWDDYSFETEDHTELFVEKED